MRWNSQDLHDAAVGFGLARSWPAQFAPVGIRIDHCLLSRHWNAWSTSIGPDLGSDHLPLVADVALHASMVIPGAVPGG